MELPARFAVLSAQKSSLTHGENVARTDRLAEELDRRGLPHFRALGFYDGDLERSFVVETDLATARELGALFDQESILWMDGKDSGLYFTDGRLAPQDGPVSMNGPETDYFTMAFFPNGTSVKFAVPINFDTIVTGEPVRQAVEVA